MHALKMLKKIGGFCNVQALHFTGIGYALSSSKRIASFVVPFAFISPSIYRPQQRHFVAPSTLFDSSKDNNLCEIQKNMRLTIDTTSTPYKNFWEVYQLAMTDVIEKLPNRPNKKISEEDFEQVKQYLFSNQAVDVESSPLVINSFANGEELREAMNDRKDRFMNVTGFSSHQYDLTMRCLVILGSICAKKHAPEPLLVAWTKMKESGMIPKPNFILSYVFVLGLDEKYAKIVSEIGGFHDLLFETTENSAYLRIKASVTDMNLKAAEEVLNKLPVRDCCCCCR